MDYIINPSWFYWINVADAIKCASLIIEIISGAILALFVMLSIGALKDAGWDKEDDEYKTTTKIAKLFGIFFAASLLTFIFLPSRDTLIEMLVAKFATVDNAKLTVDAVKDSVDYIVNAISSLK